MPSNDAFRSSMKPSVFRITSKGSKQDSSRKARELILKQVI